MSRLSNDPWSRQTGPLNFDTMVLNSDSGDVTSLHSYFNKHLMSVQQLNSILGSVSRQIRAMPQVEVFFTSPNMCTKHNQEQADEEGSQGQEEEDEKKIQS